MRLTVGNSRSARLASGIALVALAVGATPALAQTTETDTPAVHPVHLVHRVHHYVHRAKPVVTKREAKSETTGNAPEAAKPPAATPSPSPPATAGTAATPAKTEPPSPPPAAAPAPEAKATPPAEAKPTPPAPAPALAKSLLDPEVAKGYVGQPVYGRKGEKLGELSAVTTGPDGKVKSATITWGGLFGYFQSHRTVDWPTTDPALKDGKLVLGGVTLQQFRNGEQPQASR
jgi:hypothetical protein